MNAIFTLFIFCIVLFLYMHIQFHLKTSDELELYEIDDVSKERFEEICDLRQPVLFSFDNQNILRSVTKENILNHYPSFDVKVRENIQYTNKNDAKQDINYIQLPYQNALQLFRTDKQSNYYSENNVDFLTETTFIKNLNYNDSFLRPFMVSNCNYDVLFGSLNCFTPFRYELNYRTFFLVTEGSVKIKLAPPCSKKYLQPEYDYENFEFRSLINVWDPQEVYKAQMTKVKCLEFTLNAGQTLFLPSYWWYSIKFLDNSFIASFRYKTYMNNIAILPYYGLYALQNHNVKREFTKKVDISSLDSLDEKKTEKVNDPVQGTTKIEDLVNVEERKHEIVEDNIIIQEQ